MTEKSSDRMHKVSGPSGLFGYSIKIEEKSDEEHVSFLNLGDR